MKKWPKDPKQTVSYSDLIEPLTRVIRAGYLYLPRKLTVEDIPYDGYEISFREAATTPQLDERFTAECLDHSYEQGRSLLDEVLSAAFQLGIEQGRRMENARRGTFEELCDRMAGEANRLKRISE